MKFAVSFPCLISSVFLLSFGLGYIKFFGVGYITETMYTQQDKGWILQTVGALLTLGPTVIYFVAGPVAAAFPKYIVMTITALLTAGMLLFGYLTNFIGSIWMYIILTGLITGFFNSTKMAAVPLQAVESKRTTTMVNGVLTIIFTVAMLTGIPVGMYMWETYPQSGIWIAIAVFAGAGILSLGNRYKVENLSPFMKRSRLIFSDTVLIVRNYWPFLLSGPVYWGVAGAVSLSITGFVEEVKLGGATLCSLMSLWAAVGIIVGNVASNWMVHIRYWIASICGILLIILIIAYPQIILWMEPSQIIAENRNLYWLASAMFVVIGAIFGIGTNLVDSAYLESVAEDKMEGQGAALQSALVSLFNFAISGAIGFTMYKNYLTSINQFVVLAIITGLATIAVFVLWKKEKQ